MRYRRRPLLALAWIPLAGLACSTSLFGASPTTTPSSTITPTATASPTPTWTPTLTPLPAATQVVYMESVQSDGSIAVTHPALGFKFLLAKGWEVVEAWGQYELVAKFSPVKGRTITLNIFSKPVDFDLEFELLDRANQQVGAMDSMLAKGLVTNSRGTPVGYLKTAQRITGLLKAKYYHEYDILFLADDVLVIFNFTVTEITLASGSKVEFNAADLQAIQTVQNSIQAP